MSSNVYLAVRFVSIGSNNDGKKIKVVARNAPETSSQSYPPASVEICPSSLTLGLDAPRASVG